MFVVISIFYMNCNNSNTLKEEQEVKQDLENRDTIWEYWDSDYDTVELKKKIQIGNDNHQLTIRKYSLNDSSIIYTGHPKNTKTTYYDVYHDYAADIILKKEEELILQTKIDKHIFKDSLSNEFYDWSILWDLEYDGIRSNRLFFKSTLTVPDTDWQVKNDLGIFYKTNKKGQIDFYNFEEN